MIFSKFLREILRQICFNSFIKCTNTKLINAIHICVFTAFSLLPKNFLIFKFCFIHLKNNSAKLRTDVSPGSECRCEPRAKPNANYRHEREVISREFASVVYTVLLSLQNSGLNRSLPISAVFSPLFVLLHALISYPNIDFYPNVSDIYCLIV